MNQTKSYFPLIFISLEDEPWEPIEPNPNAAPEEEPVAAEPGLSESDWTLASTETVTHEYLTQNGKVARETIRQDVSGTVLKTETLDFFYDESGRPFAFNYSVDGDIASTYYYILNLQGDVVQIIDEAGVTQAEYIYSPWGEIISAEGDLAEINPLRYRGYYYDSKQDFITCKVDTMTRRIIVSLMRISMPAQTRAMRLPVICLHTAGITRLCLAIKMVNLPTGLSG